MNIVKIGAMWCPGCLVMYKTWQQLESNYPDVKITSYDLDMDSDEIEKYEVGSTLPVIIFYKDNSEYKRIVGERKYSEIEEIILEMRNN